MSGARGRRSAPKRGMEVPDAEDDFENDADKKKKQKPLAQGELDEALARTREEARLARVARALLEKFCILCHTYIVGARDFFMMLQITPKLFESKATKILCSNISG